MKKLFVCALAIGLVVAFTAPAMATDWDFYGNFQFDTYTQTLSKEANINTNYDDTDSAWGDNSISRWGGKVTKGDIFGNVEFNQAVMRHLYGEWNFGAGKLLIGHTWDLNFQGGSLENMNGGTSAMFGANGVRHDQIRLTFGNLQIAALTPNAPTKAGTGADKDITLPKMEFRYTFATDMFTIQPFLGWQSVDYNTGVADNTTDLTSTLWAVLGKVNFGPAYVNARVWGGSNTADYSFGASATHPVLAADAAVFNATTSKFDDTSILCYGIVAGFKATDTITLEAGYSARDTEITQNGVKTENSGSNEYYILAAIQLAPGVVLQPEYMKVDGGDVKVAGGAAAKRGNISYFGANWVISF